MLKLFKRRPKIQESSIVVCFGRFNPPHPGHRALFESAKCLAENNNSEYLIFPFRGEVSPLNPFTFDQKLDLMEMMFPEHINHIVTSNHWGDDLCDLINSYSCYDNIHIVMGEDVVSEVSYLIDNIDFSSNVNLYSIPLTLDENNVPYSSSTVRKLASSLSLRPLSKYLNNSLLCNMVCSNYPEHIRQENCSTTKDYQDIRESYIQGELYNVGDVVYSPETMIEGVILFRGPNYILLETERGDKLRFWLNKIEEKVHWEVGTDTYRMALQKLTPGQEVTGDYSKSSIRINNSIKKPHPKKNEFKRRK